MCSGGWDEVCTPYDTGMVVIEDQTRTKGPFQIHRSAPLGS